MIKQVLRLAAGAALLPWLGLAASCMSGSLASYVALGSSGCTIGADTLSNFQILPGTGVTELDGGAVTITPLSSASGSGLTVSINQMAINGNTIETMFTYDVSGSLYGGISSMLGGSSESTAADGVAGIVNFCEGGSFGPDGVDGCPGPNGALLTVDGVQNSDMATFAQVSLVNVTNDLMLDSGGGTASGGTLTNSFTTVPEPFSISLFALGLALAATMKARKQTGKE